MLVICLTLYFAFSSVWSDSTFAQTRNAKLIHVGWDNATPDYMAKNWAAMERMSFFDGVSVKIETDAGVPLVQKLFTQNDLTKHEFSRVEKQIRTATDGWKRHGTFTDNFAWLMLSPEDWTLEGKNFSWADDALWQQITQNAGVVARIARRSGLKGLFLDPEQYNETKFLSCEYMWRRDGFGSNPGCTSTLNPRVPGAYLPLLQRRGREFMTSVLKEYPDITIMTTMGHSAARYNGAPYNLYAGFLDGMLQAIRDAKGAKAILHDGMEMYGHRTKFDSPGCQEVKGFECLYNDGMIYGKYFSNEQTLYEKLVKGGLAVWIDMGRVWGTSPIDYSGNYYKPDELQLAVTSALEVANGYVWIYSESACFFDTRADCKPIAEPYLKAIRQAKAEAKSGINDK